MPPLKVLTSRSDSELLEDTTDHDAGAEDADLSHIAHETCSTTEAKDRDADAVEEDEGNKADGDVVQVNRADEPDCAVESDESRAGEDADVVASPFKLTVLPRKIKLLREIIYQQWSLRTGNNKRLTKMQEAKAATTLLELSEDLRDLRKQAPSEYESLLRDEPMAGRDCTLSHIIDAFFHPKTLEPLPQTYGLVCQYGEDPDLAQIARADDQTACAHDKELKPDQNSCANSAESSDRTDGGQGQGAEQVDGEQSNADSAHPSSDVVRDDEESAQLLLLCAELESHSTYVRNEVAQTAPHHANSFLYAQSRTRNVDEAGAGGELACFWVSPAQHGHKESVAMIHGKDYAKVVDPEVYLNDTIVDFQASYTYASWPAQLKERVVLLNSFFWKTLLKYRADPETTNKVLRCTRKFGQAQMLRKQYIVIPKCERSHWEMLIICNAGNALVTTGSREQSRSPAIVILDSTNGKRKTRVARLIREWLNLMHGETCEADDNREVFTTTSIKLHCVQVPQQPNFYDCGCFMLRSLQEFGRDGGFADTSSREAMAGRDWYCPSTQGVPYRQEIAANIARLMREQRPVLDKLRSQLDKPEAVTCDDQKSTEAATCAGIREADDAGEFDVHQDSLVQDPFVKVCRKCCKFVQNVAKL